MTSQSGWTSTSCNKLEKVQTLMDLWFYRFISDQIRHLKGVEMGPEGLPVLSTTMSTITMVEKIRQIHVEILAQALANQWTSRRAAILDSLKAKDGWNLKSMPERNWQFKKATLVMLIGSGSNARQPHCLPPTSSFVLAVVMASFMLKRPLAKN